MSNSENKKTNITLKLTAAMLLPCLLLLPTPVFAGIKNATLSPKIQLRSQPLQAIFRVFDHLENTPLQKHNDLRLRTSAEIEWQKPGNPALFPDDPNTDISQKMNPARISAAVDSLREYYRQSADVINEGSLDYFFTFFGYTQMFTDYYKGDYHLVLDDLISKDNAMLLSMFKIALQHMIFRFNYAYSNFLRFPHLIPEFTSNIEKILLYRKGGKDNQVKILVLGSALGEELITWAWVLRNEMENSPGLKNLDFRIIGIEKNTTSYAEAMRKLDKGYNILTALGHMVISDPDEEMIEKKLAMMSDVNANLAYYKSRISFEAMVIPSAQFSAILETADLVTSNVLWMYLNNIQRKTLLSSLELRAQKEKPIHIIGTDLREMRSPLHSLNKKSSVDSHAQGLRTFAPVSKNSLSSAPISFIQQAI